MPKTSKLGIPYPSRTPEYQREWRKLNKDKGQIYYERYRDRSRIKARERRYGITEDQYNKLLEEQDYRCAICKTDTPGRGHLWFHVDHCHETNKVRGLLCDKCNRGLGYFNDDPNILKWASYYLDEFYENN